MSNYIREYKTFKDLHVEDELDIYCQFCSCYLCIDCKQRNNDKPPSNFRLDYAYEKGGEGNYWANIQIEKHTFPEEKTLDEALIELITEEEQEYYLCFKSESENKSNRFYTCEEYSFIVTSKFFDEIRNWTSYLIDNEGHERKIISRQYEHQLILLLNHIYSDFILCYQYENIKQRKLDEIQNPPIINVEDKEFEWTEEIRRENLIGIEIGKIPNKKYVENQHKSQQEEKEDSFLKFLEDLDPSSFG